MISTSNKRSILFLTFGLAYCSLAYEVVFIELFSLLFGSIARQYNIIVSLFTFTLGLGSLLFLYLKERASLKKILVTTEIALVFTSLLGPLLLMNTLHLLSSHHLQYLSYTFAGLIGLLSGIELPVMFSMYKDSYGKVLAYDYIGMIVATILLPFFILPYFGIASSILFISFSNVFLLMFYLFHKKKALTLLFCTLYLIIICLIFLNRFSTNEYFSKLYLG